MRDYLFFAGKSTDDFNVYITDAGVYEKPDRNYEKIPVPGRNGDLIIENDKYENKPQNYPAVIMENFDENFDALTAFLLTQKGYQRLSDTFHPDIFYLATFDGIDKLKHTLEPKAGSFVLKFNRKPQRFLVSGEKKTTFTNSGEIKNPTLFDALPLICVIGIGILEIGNVSVKILNAPGGVYTGIYIDSDLQEAYVGDLNCNGMIELVDGKFPVLNGGINVHAHTVISYQNIFRKPQKTYGNEQISRRTGQVRRHGSFITASYFCGSSVTSRYQRA